MTERVTNALRYDVAAARLRSNFAELYKLQLDLSTGKKIRLPSDDPAGAAKLLTYGRLKRDLEQYGIGADLARGQLDVASRELTAAAESLSEAKARILGGLNGTASPGDRAAIADEIEAVVQSLVRMGNAQGDGRYLFGGARSDAPPFEVYTGPDGLRRVRYLGDDKENRVEISAGVYESTNVPGLQAFGGGARGPTEIVGGGTGVAPAAGARDSAKGRAALSVLHVATYFGAPPSTASSDPASGLALGTSGGAFDTLLGNGRTVSLAVAPGGGGTVSLDGGPTVAFAAGDADLAVTGPNGEVVRLDFRAVTPGFVGTATLRGAGALSLDGGATSTPIDFAATLQQVEAPDGGVMHVDPRQVRKAGVERVTFRGTVTVFDALLGVAERLRAGGPADDVAAALDEARTYVAEIDAGQERLLAALALVSGGATRAEQARSRIDDLAIDLAGRRSQVEDVDVAAAIVRMSEREATYQSSLAVTARLNDLSLVQFLR